MQNQLVLWVTRIVTVPLWFNRAIQPISGTFCKMFWYSIRWLEMNHFMFGNLPCMKIYVDGWWGSTGMNSSRHIAPSRWSCKNKFYDVMCE